ncbi:hypothetical protein C8F01DRAFT_987763 [Mycena amicta]|nr:hypothetical protein C8F01DRAFT_987763 [Mycena amicta]
MTPVPACPEHTAVSAWICKVYGEITGVNLGAAYNDTLAAYFALEASYGYVNGTGRLSAENCPPQMYEWIHHKRIARPAYCTINDPASFATEFWTWWTGLQPPWRETTTEIQPYNAERKGESWGGLVVPGINGMLTAVAMVYWWGCEEKTRGSWPTGQWVDAVEDVRRVCEGLRDEAEDEGRQTKKRKLV